MDKTIDQKIEELLKNQPKIPPEGIERIKRNHAIVAKKKKEKEEFKSLIEEGIEFVKNRIESVDMSMFSFHFYDHVIGIGILLDFNTLNINTVACMCTPEDIAEKRWSDHIARGLLGYRLKSALLKEKGASDWWIIDHNLKSKTLYNPLSEAKIAMDDLIYNAMNYDSTTNVEVMLDPLPKFFSNRHKQLPYIPIPVIRQIKLPKPKKTNTNT